MSKWVAGGSNGGGGGVSSVAGNSGAVTAQQLAASLGSVDVDGAPVLLDKKLPVATTAYSTLRLLRANTRDVTLLFMGDSTLLQTKPWPLTFLGGLAVQYPAFSFIYHKWNDANSNFDAGISIQTGTGTNTVHLWNFSMSGKTAQYYQGALWPIATGLLNADPDLMLISQGHNEPTNADQFRSRIIGLSEFVRSVYPLADLFLLSENPATTGTANLARSQEIQRICALRGYGFINATDMFLALGSDMATYIQGDGIHPTEAGMDLIANLVLGHFRWGVGAVPRDSEPSTFLQPGENLVADGAFINWASGTPAGWNAVGTATVTKDTTNFETGTGGVRVVSTAASASLDYDISSAFLASVKGRYVCLAVRLRVPTGQVANVGRIGLDWGGGSLVQSQLLEGQGGFRWAVQHVKVPTTATRVRIRIFASDSTVTAGGDLTIDRVSLTRGLFPRDVELSIPATTGGTSTAGGFGFPATVDTALLRGSDSQTLTANRAVYMRCRDGGTISSVGLAVVVASGNISVAAYSNTGTGRAAQPGALLASSGSVACPAAGYAEVSLGSTVTLQPGDWLAICPDNATASFRSGLTGLLTNGLGTGREYVRDNSFPLAGSNPTSLQASLGPPIVLVGA